MELELVRLAEPKSLDSRTSGHVFVSFTFSSFSLPSSRWPCLAKDSVQIASRSFTLSFFGTFLIFFLSSTLVWLAMLFAKFGKYGLMLFKGDSFVSSCGLLLPKGLILILVLRSFCIGLSDFSGDIVSSRSLLS